MPASAFVALRPLPCLSSAELPPCAEGEPRRQATGKAGRAGFLCPVDCIAAVLVPPHDLLPPEDQLPQYAQLRTEALPRTPLPGRVSDSTYRVGTDSPKVSRCPVRSALACCPGDRALSSAGCRATAGGCRGVGGVESGRPTRGLQVHPRPHCPAACCAVPCIIGRRQQQTKCRPTQSAGAHLARPIETPTEAEGRCNRLTACMQGGAAGAGG